jgi:hypothetical protein
MLQALSAKVEHLALQRTDDAHRVLKRIASSL